MSGKRNTDSGGGNMFAICKESYGEEIMIKDDGPSKSEENTFTVDLNKESLLKSIILSEILGSPKSKIKGGRLGRRRPSPKELNSGV